MRRVECSAPTIHPARHGTARHGTHIATWLYIQTDAHFTVRGVFSHYTCGYFVPMKRKCNFQRNSNTQGARDFCSIPDFRVCLVDFKEGFIFDVGWWEIRLQKNMNNSISSNASKHGRMRLELLGQTMQEGIKSRNDTTRSSLCRNSSRKLTFTITASLEQTFLIIILPLVT
jgi:hypothetical protein